MTEYRLKKLKKLSGEPVTISSDPEGELLQLDSKKGTKYALSIDVGNLPPQEVCSYMLKIREQLGGFFGDGNVLFLPRRGEGTGMEIYELEPAQCCERDHDKDGDCDRHPVS